MNVNPPGNGGAAVRLRGKLHLAEPPLPDYLSVAVAHQRIPAAQLAEMDRFIAVFDRVTRRSAWVREALRTAPAAAPPERPEVCFFSAWDFHLPPERPGDWQLIEFNDNGSGFLFAAQINRVYYDLFLQHSGLPPPPSPADLGTRIQAMIADEARAFFGARRVGGLLILDDADSLQQGRFRQEHGRLAALTRAQGWRTCIASPSALDWDGERLKANGEVIDFIVNRSTDFHWQAPEFEALREAWRASQLYVAPNPFTYATRSDKRLLCWLSRPDRDSALGITADERALLSRHVPPTWPVDEDDLEALADRKLELVFKPAQSHAGLGVLDSRQVGRQRLRRLLARGEKYVAQQRVAKGELRAGSGARLWTDLRIWSWRGRRYLVSGRASRQAERLDLEPPGGWLPTFEVT